MDVICFENHLGIDLNKLLSNRNNSILGVHCHIQKENGIY